LIGILIIPKSIVFYILTALLLALAAVPIATRAAALLDQKDPPSVVIDEIVALPLAYFPMAAWFIRSPPQAPLIYHFIFLSILAFVLFRIFDIWKPWIIHKSQNLPRGWGIVIDDILAAAATALIMSAIILVIYKIHFL
jgi:phosphatidylglycerophosphatase A